MDSVNVNLFGTDPRVQKAITVARNVAATKAPVLIVGEAGVGKKTLGMYIHQQSTRARAVCDVVDCLVGPEDVENAMLGFRDDESGHFVRGALERCNGGTVILANIDGLEESFQKKLHQIIGELADYDIDIRFVITTSKNLSKLVGAGRFYRGLYTMLAGTQIALPPLRERQDDLKMIADYYVEKYSKEFGVEIAFGDQDYNKILSYYWTHNYKELSQVIKGTICGGDTSAMAREQDTASGETQMVMSSETTDNDGIRLMSLKDAERLLIKKALVHTSENRTQAARILGVSIRTLRNKINEYRGAGNSYFMSLR